MCAKRTNRIRVNETTKKLCAQKQKPVVTIIHRAASDGISLINSSAAARFCGVSQQAFQRVVRTFIRRMLDNAGNRQNIYRRVEDVVKRTYPELFDHPVIIEG